MAQSIEPKGGTGRRVPIMVGGNGPNVTWRLAARYADELNLDGLSPQEVDAALPIIRSRCEEIGRDPASLPVSVHIWTADARQPGRQRIERLAAYRDLGIIRVTCLLRDLAAADEPLVALAEDARAAGLSMSTPS
jgi:alkanesulfonate monooxygenase SsuD/methylene tetrahydromethanopterin reductase-like flavin-dependent oxidoreductase (luciferase family)